MNKNPWAWFGVVVVLGLFYSPSGFDGVVLFVLAVILAKQIEIINKLNK